MWSAIGLPIALTVGSNQFSKMLDGAKAMDEHFVNTDDPTQNIPTAACVLSAFAPRLGYLHRRLYCRIASPSAGLRTPSAKRIKRTATPSRKQKYSLKA